MERIISAERVEDILNVFGSFDQNLHIIEKEWNVCVTDRDAELKISGEPEDVVSAEKAVQNLLMLAARGETVDEQRVRYVIGMIRSGQEDQIRELDSGVVCITAKGRPVKPKTLGQKAYVQAIRENTVTLGIGPAGTGKTYLAVAAAVAAFREKSVNRIILTRPAVEAGELLISGVEDTETVGARVLTGMGKVEARTWYTLSTVMPLTVAEKQYTGEEKQGYSLVFGTNRVKFFLNSSIGTGNYDKITERTQWSLFGLPLPVTFVKETFRFYETVPAEVSAAQAESRGEAILTDYLHTLVDPYGTVSSTLCTSRREGDGLLVTLTAECVEEIGRAVPIYTDPTEESGG